MPFICSEGPLSTLEGQGALNLLTPSNLLSMPRKGWQQSEICGRKLSTGWWEQCLPFILCLPISSEGRSSSSREEVWKRAPMPGSSTDFCLTPGQNCAVSFPGTAALKVLPRMLPGTGITAQDVLKYCSHLGWSWVMQKLNLASAGQEKGKNGSFWWKNCLKGLGMLQTFFFPL